MKISYAVTVADEIKEIQTLLPLLIENKREDDEIIVQYDTKNLLMGIFLLGGHYNLLHHYHL